ncbi:2-aminoadipate transaminase [Ruminococcus sp. YE71]|uniref:aminotransferase-like domain-containing protein n=1 Tax=unclassified Ruminococcus TaxID=2608920 RepID=UPI0008830550|nr:MULTISPECIES: PLP-dependent aminotransferase family protein [unclassified Ruminococcus]SDA32952.1 2-aminoadipate transaminase [Ruminococcus sp. YE78]SFW54695.1 2-aminoadipate transaminase [Ruminococcus sp. YE71]
MEFQFSEKVSHLQASAIREILKYSADPAVISLAAGSPAPEALPTKQLEEISKEILAEEPSIAFQYGVTEGYTPLRDEVKKILADKGVYNPEYDEVIITSGAQQANELSAKVLCNEGDVLLAESPSFIGSLNAFKSYHVDLKGVTLESDGINIEELEARLKEGGVKLVYLIPNFQNPTGNTMSWEKRVKAFELCKKYGAVILEDNPYGDLRFAGEDIKCIKTLDTEGSVIYSGTFSKILAPGIRVGYVCAHKDIIQKIVVCKQVADVHSTMWSQMLAYRFLNKYDLAEHLVSLRKVYKHKTELMLGEIAKNFSSKIEYTKPQGGLFIWCTLPEGVTTQQMLDFCTKAVKEYKVAIVPGTAFEIHEDDPTRSFRLNFSTPTDENIVKGIGILGKLSKEMFGE